MTASNPLIWAIDVVVIGSLVGLTLGVVGLIRMADVFNRIHAMGQAVPLGILPLTVAVTVTVERAAALKACLLLVFILLTTPVTAHLIARTALLERGRGDKQPMDR